MPVHLRKSAVSVADDDEPITADAWLSAAPPLSARCSRALVRSQARWRGKVARLAVFSLREESSGPYRSLAEDSDATRRQSAVVVQAAGHAGMWERASDTVLVKQATLQELAAYESIPEALKPFTPGYHGAEARGAIALLKLTDATAGRALPVVMDIKMGKRTFLEAEGGNTKLRPDLVDKMKRVDAGALTAEQLEHGITKLQYLSFRDGASSTSTLGWRIEGIRLGPASYPHDCKTLRGRGELAEALKWFLSPPSAAATGALARARSFDGGAAGSGPGAPPSPKPAVRAELRAAFLAALVDLRGRLEASEWFLRREVVASSILFVYDGAADREPNLNVWLIDFAKTEELPDGGRLDHRAAWTMGNREDGYLEGLDSLIELWSGLE